MEEEGPQYPSGKGAIEEETDYDEFEMQTKRKAPPASHLDMA
jgi:hypothetical protein